MKGSRPQVGIASSVAVGLLCLTAYAAGGETADHGTAASGGGGVWIQVGVHGPGTLGARWRTDLGLRNVADEDALVEVRFYPQDGSDMQSMAAQVGPGVQKVLTDVVGQIGGAGSGAVEVVADQLLIVTSRTYNLIADDAECTPEGTFGQYYDGYRLSEGLAEGESAWLVHLAESSGFRTNLAFTNMGEVDADVQVELFDGAGSLLKTFNLDLAPAQYHQEFRVFRNRADQTAMQRGSARVTVIEGAGIIASASVVDNITNDPTTIPMIMYPGVPGESVWLQVGAHNPGLHGSQWRTDLGLRNVAEEAAVVEVRFYPEGSNDFVGDIVQVAAGAQSVLVDVVGQLGASGTGAMEIIPTQPVVVTSRTYNLIADDAECTPGGTFGQYYAGHGVAHGLAEGDSAWLAQLSEGGRFRSNLALTNMGEEDATVEVQLFDGAGAMVTEFAVNLAPARYRQELRVFRNRADLSNVPQGSARVMVAAGAGIIASASVVDNITNDPTTIPALQPFEAAVPPNEVTIMLPGDVPLVMVRIPAGTFMMGNPDNERGSFSGGGSPQHQVTLTQDYYLGKYPVTQRQWLAVMNENPSYFIDCGLDCPVERVTWDDVCGGETGSTCVPESFIGRLRTHMATTGQPGKVRMPTEAEWERGARGGTTGPFSFDVSGNPEWDVNCGVFPEADAHMWWCGNNTDWGQPGHGTKPVGQKLPNPFGLYDVHGLVLEWVGDWWEPYTSEAKVDPTGPPTGSSRVVRGGDWQSKARECRSATRLGSTGTSFLQGFRLAMSL